MSCDNTTLCIWKRQLQLKDYFYVGDILGASCTAGIGLDIDAAKRRVNSVESRPQRQCKDVVLASALGRVSTAR